MKRIFHSLLSQFVSLRPPRLAVARQQRGEAILLSIRKIASSLKNTPPWPACQGRRNDTRSAILSGFIVLLSAMALPGLSSGNSIVWAEEDTSNLPASPQDLLKDLASGLDSLKNPFTQQLPVPPPPPMEIEVQSQGPVVPILPRGEPPRAQAAVNLPAITISGLVWDTDQPQAIVNKKIVGVGDKIEDWAITAINEQGIEISWKGIKRFIANKFDHNDDEATF